MRAYELILRKRDGGALSADEIAWFIRAYTDGGIPDYQASAMLMAVFLRGLDDAELAAWTTAMLDSGDRLDLADVPGVKVDKHSTGGVGDKASIPLVPLVVACGVPVPMIAGRGLGHTGGTIDKLESIPGFRTDLDEAAFRRQLRELGGAIIGQTERLAPADRKLYALRDATATVESIPLIASSIMSKKLAEGCDALLLDVKVGAGAFMKDLASARLLAGTMIEIGARMGRRMAALLTRMDEPLGYAVGNALEVVESVELLQGGGPADLVDLTVEMGAEMLVLGGAAGDVVEGRGRIRGAVASGKGLEALGRLVAAQGGDPAAIHDPARLPRAPRCVPMRAGRSGWVGAIRADEVGLAAVSLGAGRSRKEDAVDPAVGFVLAKKVGDRVEAGESIGLAHVGGRFEDDAAIARATAAFTIVDEAPPRHPLILERMSR